MLLWIQEPGKPPRSMVATPGVTIGRGAPNNVPLDDDAASSRHAELALEGGALCIKDLGSSNGTRVVGGAKLARGESHPLAPGLEVQVGRTLIRVLHADDTEQTLRPGSAPNDATLRPATPSAVPDAATVRPAAKSAPVEDATVRAAAAPSPSAAPTAAPAPAPTPAPKPAAQPVKPQSAPMPEESFEGTLYVGPGGTGEAAMAAALAALKPRLACVVKKNGQSIPVPRMPAVIGRALGGDVALALEDEGVSSRHAQLGFDGLSFHLEDLGGRNGTFVGAMRLTKGAGVVDLPCDQHVKIGTVDALFVREARMGEAPPPSQHYSAALDVLAQDPSVPKDKLRDARARLQSGGHPGEHLIVANAIGVAQWCAALEQARLRGILRQGGSKSSPLVWALAAALLATLAVLGWMLSR